MSLDQRQAEFKRGLVFHPASGVVEQLRAAIDRREDADLRIQDAMPAPNGPELCGRNGFHGKALILGGGIFDIISSASGPLEVARHDR